VHDGQQAASASVPWGKYRDLEIQDTSLRLRLTPI